MAKEPDQTRWVGIRPTDPAENIPVTESAPLTSVQVEPKPGSADFPVKESAPLTSIKVSPLVAGTTFNTITKKKTPAISDLQAIEAVIAWEYYDQAGGVGTITQDTGAVPAGKLWVVTFASHWNDSGSCVWLYHIIRGGAADYWIQALKVAAIGVALTSANNIVLAPGEYWRFYWNTPSLATNRLVASFRAYQISQYT